VKRIFVSAISAFAINVAAIGAMCAAFTISSYAADTSVQVQMDMSKATPRSMEPLTERAVLRDYRFAWASMAQALESNSIDSLQGPFEGDAMRWLKETVLSQQQSGISQRYRDQSHRVEAVFYSPEGDVLELHDTVQYQLQISDGGKVIHDDPVTLHYVVLLTPGADRWVIRQLQAVQQF
jgi:hypothetical protein